MPSSRSRAPSPTALPDTPCSRRLFSRTPFAPRSVRLKPDTGVVLAGDERPRERAGTVRIALALVISVREHRQRSLALDDPAIALAVLLGDELVQPARLLDVLRDVGRKRRRHLADACELDREARLAARLDDPLRLRDELGLAQPAGRHRRADEPLGVLRAHVAVDAFGDRLGAQLGDRVARVDALRAALVAEVAARALPDAVLAVDELEPVDLARVAGVADEAHRLRERLRAEEVGIRLHRAAFGDAAAAVDAERLLVDHVHPLLRDAELTPAGRLLVAGLQVGVDRPELVPEGPH